MTSELQPETLVRRRANQRDMAIAVMIMAGLVLATAPLRLPLPVWIKVVFGVLLLAAGVYNFVRAYRLPSQEVLILI
jgi:hypothetical protein